MHKADNLLEADLDMRADKFDHANIERVELGRPIEHISTRRQI